MKIFNLSSKLLLKIIFKISRVNANKDAMKNIDVKIGNKINTAITAIMVKVKKLSIFLFSVNIKTLYIYIRINCIN